jgi:hypothetical protein
MELDGLGVADALDRVVIGRNRQVTPDADLPRPRTCSHSRKVLRKPGVGELTSNHEAKGVLVHFANLRVHGIQAGIKEAVLFCSSRRRFWKLRRNGTRPLFPW